MYVCVLHAQLDGVEVAGFPSAALANGGVGLLAAGSGWFDDLVVTTACDSGGLQCLGRRAMHLAAGLFLVRGVRPLVIEVSVMLIARVHVACAVPCVCVQGRYPGPCARMHATLATC